MIIYLRLEKNLMLNQVVQILIERIESGLLSYGNDFDNNDNPFECGFDQYVSLE